MFRLLQNRERLKHVKELQVLIFHGSLDFSNPFQHLLEFD